MPDENKKSFINVSSNVLFHFTKSRENLVNILRKDFRPHFCPEYDPYESTFAHLRREPPEFARPMICFCDLPLFLIKEHLNRYGPYGIGLNKEWGMKKGITPVFYVHDWSETLKPLERIRSLVGWQQGGPDAEMESIQSDAESAANWIMSYAKPYEGPAWRNDEYVEHVRFYDEREWRFTPAFLAPGIDAPHWIRYTAGMDLSRANLMMEDLCALSFTPSDIQYIILKKEVEILPFIPILANIKGKFGPDQVSIVTTKIITSERIQEDM